MAGSNIIEFRVVRKWNDASKTVQNDLRLQFRTKDVILGVLGVTLGVWSDWQDFDGLEVEDIVG